MGMDLIEIIVRIEDAFGIKIPDADAVRMTTPRKLTDFVATKVCLSDKSSCLSQQAFYFLREKFQTQLSFSRQSFRPNSLLEDFIPSENRRVVWEKLQLEVGKDVIPDLVRPLWLFLILAVLTVFVFGYVAFIVWQNLGGVGVTLIFGLLSAIVFGCVLAVLSLPAKHHFRRDYQHVGEIARYLVINKPHVFKRHERTWTRAEIVEVVRSIVSDYVCSREFSDDADFIKDLRLD